MQLAKANKKHRRKPSRFTDELGLEGCQDFDPAPPIQLPVRTEVNPPEVDGSFQRVAEEGLLQSKLGKTPQAEPQRSFKG